MDLKTTTAGVISRDLRTIFEIVARQLSQANVDCILIGGFAVNYHGYTRNTLDVDFMIVAEQLDDVRRIMTGAGFTNMVADENVAFFNEPGSPMRVDFLRVDENTMCQLLNNAISARIYGYEIKVPALQDLIAMKIFSLSRDIARRSGKDLPDIAFLCFIHNLDLEREIRSLCKRYGTPDTYDLIREQVEALRNS